MTNTPWADEPTEELKRLYKAGTSYLDIAIEVGKSRSAVAGKVKRLGLCGTVHTPRFKAENKPRKPRSPKPRSQSTSIRKEKPVQLQEPQGPGVAFPRKSFLTCAWPTWTDETPPAERKCCGAATAIGASLCEYHRRRSYVKHDHTRSPKPFVVRAA